MQPVYRSQIDNYSINNISGKERLSDLLRTAANSNKVNKDEKIHLNFSLFALQKSSDLTENQKYLLEDLEKLPYENMSPYIRLTCLKTCFPFSADIAKVMAEEASKKEKERLLEIFGNVLNKVDSNEKELISLSIISVSRSANLTNDQKLFLEDLEKKPYENMDPYLRKLCLNTVFPLESTAKILAEERPKSEKERLLIIFKNAMRMVDDLEKEVLNSSIESLSKSTELTQNQKWLLEDLEKTPYEKMDRNLRLITLRTAFSK